MHFSLFDFLSPAAAAAPSLSGEPARETCVGLSTAYNLTLQNFDSEEIIMIEEYFASCSGYEHNRPRRSGARKAVFWYETCSDAGRLNRCLQLISEHVGVEVRLGMVQSRLEIKKKFGSQGPAEIQKSFAQKRFLGERLRRIMAHRKADQVQEIGQLL